MRGLVGFCLRRRFVVLAFAIVLVLVGIYTTRQASFDAFPEFAPPRVEIQTEAPGLTSEDVEALVTNPLEAALVGTPGVTEIRSKSVLGLSSVLLIFERGTDVLEARALVAERIPQAKLTSVSRPPVVLPPLSSTSRVLKVGVASEALSQMELTDVVRWGVRPRLMAVPGVANVAIWGERTRELQVRVDTTRLLAHGVALGDVVAAGQRSAAPTAGGFIEGANQRLPVVHPLPTIDVATMSRLPVAVGSGPAVTMDDVAEVVEAPAPPIGDALVTTGEGLLLIVEKQPGANTLEVTRGIDQALEELQPALPGIEFDATIFRPAGFIERALQNLGEAMAIGTALVVVVLVVFLWDWRTALISAIAIPVSLLAAATALTLAGYTLDTMVLAGLIIALGEVVDDAIIDVENIHRRLQAHTGDWSPRVIFRLVLDASLEVRSAVVYATMIVVSVFVPILFLPGVAGAFFRPLALAYGIAVLASMVVALTITPALSMVLLTGERDTNKSAGLSQVLRRVYDRMLRSVLRHPRAVLVATAVLLGTSAVTWTSLDQTFLPHFAENDFLMHWVGKPGTSLPGMTRTADRVRQELLAIDGVRNFGAHIGRAEVADEVVGPNFAELWISVDPDTDLEATLEEVSGVIEGYPGIYRDVQTYLQERVREVLTGGSGAIIVRIFGPDLGVLAYEGEQVAALLEAVPGVSHASAGALTMVPQVEVVPNLERCAALGIDPGAVRAEVATLIQGTAVGTFVRGQQPINIVVRAPPSQHGDVSSIRGLMIGAGGGKAVRLADIADVRVRPMQTGITHLRGTRKLDVTVELEPGADLTATAERIDEALAFHRFTAGHYAETSGEHIARDESVRVMLGASGLSIVFIFLVLLADFRSVRLAGIVMLSLPLSSAGAVAAVAATGGVVSLGTVVGFVTVIGITARNGVLLIAHLRHLQDEEGQAFGVELVVRAARERLAPIVMTAASTGLALLPLVVVGPRAGHEIEYPMAIVILGGLVSSTILNLWVTPALALSALKTRMSDEPTA
ncbi:MAG: efflux RND transporter permease subunit [Nannocystales bacterium]